jgi:hypothetical protein
VPLSLDTTIDLLAPVAHLAAKVEEIWGWAAIGSAATIAAKHVSVTSTATVRNEHAVHLSAARGWHLATWLNWWSERRLLWVNWANSWHWSDCWLPAIVGAPCDYARKVANLTGDIEEQTVRASHSYRSAIDALEVVLTLAVRVGDQTCLGVKAGVELLGGANLDQRRAQNQNRKF